MKIGHWRYKVSSQRPTISSQSWVGSFFSPSSAHQDLPSHHYTLLNLCTFTMAGQGETSPAWSHAGMGKWHQDTATNVCELRKNTTKDTVSISTGSPSSLALGPVVLESVWWINRWIHEWTCELIITMLTFAFGASMRPFPPTHVSLLPLFQV